MSAGNCVGSPRDPELHRLLDVCKWGVFGWSLSSLAEDLHRTLPDHSSPEENDAVRPSEPRFQRVLESVYDTDSEFELVSTSELLEALRQSPYG